MTAPNQETPSQDEAEGVAAVLLAHGADPNATMDGGSTPLHHAVRWPVTGAKPLIDAGVDVNATDNKGNAPLHLAATAEATRLLLAHGAHVSARNKAGETPLLVICGQGGWIAKTVRLLHEHGADPNAVGSDRTTPLGRVHRTAQPLDGREATQLLLEYGARLDPPTSSSAAPPR